MTHYPYRHILFATDLSAACDEAGRRAMDLARRFGARLTMLHVVGSLDYAYGSEEMPLEGLDLEGNLVNLAKRDLADLAERLGGGEAEQWVVIGSAKEEIVRLAEEWQVDLIIMGSHGRRGWRLLLGSTVDAVAHMASCDILAIRSDVAFRSPGDPVP